MAKEAIGIKSYTTYIKTLNDLVRWEFVLMVQKSKNQYSANIIALPDFNKADAKALDKAFIKHLSKQSESTYQSIGSIDKQETIQQDNKKQNVLFGDFWNLYDKKIGDTFKLEVYWFGLDNATKHLIMDWVARYKKFEPDAKFRVNVQKFFEEKYWMGEIPKRNGKEVPANMQDSEL